MQGIRLRQGDNFQPPFEHCRYQVMKDVKPLTHRRVLSDIDLVAWGGRGCSAATIAAVGAWSVPSRCNGRNERHSFLPWSELAQ